MESAAVGLASASASMKLERRRADRANRQRQKLWCPSESRQRQQPTIQPTQRRCVCPTDNCTPTNFPPVWSKLRSSQQLCDAVIRCADGNVYPVHRVILSTVSPYFRVSFTSHLGAEKPSGHELVLPDVSGDAFGHVLDYAYTGSCRIGVDNVEQLLPLADKLEVLGLVQLCCQFLLGELRPDNCLGIYKFAQHYFCQDLKEKGRRYILQNFSKILRLSNEFKELACEELEPILRDDELNARNEELVFEAIKAWVELRPNERTVHLPKLLRCPRYGLMRPGYFENNVFCWSVTQNMECKEVLLPVAAYLEERLVQQQQPACSSQLTADQHNEDWARPRVPHEILFAIGGWTAGSPTNFIETYDTRADRWFLSSYTDITQCVYHGICSLNNLIYVVGGSDGHQPLNNLRCFNPVTKEWRERACMYQTRCYVSVCVHDGKIYALGGNNGIGRMRSCERYDPAANQWEIIAPMNKRRSDSSCAVLGDRIYVAGGYDGSHVLDSVEVYDITTGQWSYVARMRVSRSGVSLVAFKDCLYAIGGFNGYARLNSVEKYKPNQTQKREWQEIKGMLHARSNFATAIIDDMIFVIGGFNGKLPMPFVEYYDGNDWHAAAPMNFNRSALSVCVVTGLANVREYSYNRENSSQQKSGGDVGNSSSVIG